ncbi:MAG: Threonine synthase [Candidatus Ozemobacter sibiricus]|uniref:Threonine synthase n=1 Tax=Candidatus Ozemobacter sibiricus TaxID=2268124 RepID=A0A367ZMH2_9BACT|nr:MAG: Threonine synthase [Candidatus Ozemobacter sibiricus]
MSVIGMKCMKCGKEFAPAPDRYVCDVCGIEGILDILYDYSKIKLTRADLEGCPERSLWRYRPLLPLGSNTPVSPLQVGWTPLYHLPRYEQTHGARVLLKDDGRNPTASLKDRASAVAVAKAFEAGAQAIAAASTGNAASSLAGFAASVGLRTFIFVPKRAPKAKLAQLLVYGANTIVIDDTYDRAFELSVEVSRRLGFYNRNCAYNPYCVEGKKTVAYEMWEQNGFRVPDRVYVSIGDGCITSGIYKGFYDLMQIGLTDRVPRLIGVQAATCNPVEVALRTGVFTPQSGNTIADSIAVGIPRNRLKAMRALRESKGDCISVTDEAIKQALVEMPRQTGVFGEPAGVTAWAGFQKDLARGAISKGETVVVLITGNGLKDIESAISVCHLPAPVPPDLATVEAHVRRLV